MPGWMRRSRTASAVLCLLVGAAVQAAGTPDAQPERDSLALPEDFLVFLGEWQDELGNWQDPMVFDGPGWQVLDKHAEQRNETD